MNYLLDSGFFYALTNDEDGNHVAVSNAARSLRGSVYLPTVATTEIAYLLQRDLGTAVLIDFLAQLISGSLIVEEPVLTDYERAASVITQYSDSNIDFVDAVIVTMAERMNITRILTVDQRHFRLFRPRHCAAFELLP